MSHLWLPVKTNDPTYPDLITESARLSPAIVHFEGLPTVKPWNHRSIHPLRFQYRALRATTPWPLEALEGTSLTSTLLRRLPVRLQYAIAREKRRVGNKLRRRRRAWSE